MHAILPLINQKPVRYDYFTNVTKRHYLQDSSFVKFFRRSLEISLIKTKQLIIWRKIKTAMNLMPAKFTLK
jgi:hypothetical protein